MNKLNKTLIAILLVLCVGLVGITIAYFSNSTEIENEFITKEYGTTYTEDFVSPSNWLPGDTTDKTVTVTNSGQVDEAVRISLSETWTPNDSNATLTGWIHADGTKSNHTTEEELATDVRAAIINFTENSDWTKVGDYYYYNYRLQPGETTSSLIESVTFNALTKLGDTCVTSSENGIKTITCNSSGTDYDNATYKLTINVETVQYNKYASAWGTGNSVAILEEKPAPVVQQTGAEYLASSATNAVDAEYNDSTKGNMFTFSHTVNGKTVNESRYIGDVPNNYVYFNCDEPQEGVEYNYANSCEVWRILGTFDVERTDPSDSTKTITETRMKLVRGTDLATTRMWDNRTSEDYPSRNYGKNDWNGSLMQTFLTGDYYNRTGEATSNGLKASAQAQIEDAIFYLGGKKSNSSQPYYGSTEEVYAWERGTEVYNETRPTSWEGKVALMYLSDMYMTYAKGVDNTCYNDPNSCYNGTPTKGWVHNTNKLEESDSQQWTWFVSPRADGSYIVFYANGDGGLYSSDGNRAGGVRPVVYLKSDIGIASGTGEVGSPYVLE